MFRIVLALIAIANIGCQMDASIINLNAALPLPNFPAKATGIVSGSNQTGYVGSTPASAEYRVQSTLGSYISTLDQKTVGGEYKVFSSVQGAIIAE